MNRQTRLPSIARTAVMSGALVVLFSGCLGSKASAPSRAATRPSGAYLEPTPAELGAVPARIVSVNSEHSFVVIDFGSQVVPAAGTQVNVYRGDKRAGAVRITEPVRAPFATADVLEGQVRVGDETR